MKTAYSIMFMGDVEVFESTNCLLAYCKANLNLKPDTFSKGIFVYELMNWDESKIQYNLLDNVIRRLDEGFSKVKFRESAEGEDILYTIKRHNLEQ